METTLGSMKASEARKAASRASTVRSTTTTRARSPDGSPARAVSASPSPAFSPRSTMSSAFVPAATASTAAAAAIQQAALIPPPDAAAGGASGWRHGESVRPVGRGEAVILESALDDILPTGSLSQRHPANVVGTGGKPAVATELADLKKDWQAVAMVNAELARQVMRGDDA